MNFSKDQELLKKRADSEDKYAFGAVIYQGCGYQGYEFGANYPDSVCLGGWLFDADSGYSIPEGWAYTRGGDIPCPKCNSDKRKPRLKK